MIILITGASLTGKTLLAQRMLEEYRIPYLSIDHLKMGLIRSGMTDLTPKDDKPLLALIASLLKKGVEVRLIHAKEPGTAWREDHEKHPILYDGMERVLCPRVHFKLIIIDSTIAYVGSANLTGAGMGMKSLKKRNFEAGILTDDPEMLEEAIEQFDNVWIGKFCKDCGRREYCSDPIK